MQLFDENANPDSALQSQPASFPEDAPMDSSGIGMSDGAMQPPQGIGMAAPAPDVAMQAPAMPRPVSARQAEFDKLNMGEKIALGLQEIGAVMQGKESIVDKRVAQSQQSRLLQQQDFQQRMQSMETGMKMAQGLQGDARTDFIKRYAADMDKVYPGSAGAFEAIAKQPDVGKNFMKYAPQSATVRWAMETDPSGAMITKMMQDPKQMERITSEIDQSQIFDKSPTSPFSKLKSIMGGLQQVLPPQMYETFMKDGEWSESEVRKANEFIANHPNQDMRRLALTEEQFNLASKYGEDVFPKLKIVPGASEMKITERQLEKAPELAEKKRENDMQDARAKATLAEQKRAHDMQNARAKQQSDEGKIPAGYRRTEEGNLEPIPGGPADIKSGEAASKAAKLKQTAATRADIVTGKVDEALKKVGVLTTGAAGQVLKNVGGTDAYDLDKTVDTIKAVLGFEELQAMRNASPTGGALGQVAVKELDLLQSTIASLDVGQSKGQIVKNLNAIKKHVKNWKDAVEESNKDQSGRPPLSSFKK